MSVNMDLNRRKDFDIDANRSIRGESNKVEDVARSIGYIVGAPVVCVTSIVSAGLCLFVAPCCFTGMALHSDDPETGATLLKAAAETLTAKPSIRCLVKMNKGFYDWAKPFKRRVKVIHPSHAHKN